MKIDFSEVIFTVESRVTFSEANEPKDGFYPMQMYLWLEESSKEATVW